MPTVAPFATDKPLISPEVITAELDAIEEPLTQAQAEIVKREKDRLMAIALPMVEAKNLEGIAGLEWNAAIALQVPIYEVWAAGFALGAVHMQQAVRAGIPRRERGQFSGTPESSERYTLDLNVARLLGLFLEMEPGQLVASAVQGAVLNRVIQLAGNFSSRQIADVKGHLIAAIAPQADTGNPISRDELLKRISNTLNAGYVRSENIARTELTTAYNTGRVRMGLQSELVEAFRFIAISDSRTTDICNSRNGMIIPAGDQFLLNANTPAMHYRCRSTLSPVMPRVNRIHRGWINNSDRRAENMAIAPLLPDWN